jgi:hypothetical protein
LAACSAEPAASSGVAASGSAAAPLLPAFAAVLLPPVESSEVLFLVRQESAV